MDAGDVSQEGFLPKKKKKTDEESEKRRKKITQGSLMKAIIRAGEGTEKPVEEDQVIFHCTTRTLDGVIVDSTRIEHGGKGYPSRLVMGKSKMILGFLEGIPTMLIGEIAMACGTISVNERLDLIDEKIYSVSVDFNKLHYEFKMRPELHYAEVDCPVTAPDTIPKDDELHFEIEMLDFHKSKVVSEDLGVTKKIIIEGQGWETPRELYEVQAWISAKSTDGKMVLSHAQEPYNFTFGKSELPKGLEMGIATMTHGEKAAIYVTKTYLTPSPIMPSLETYEEVQFVVELVHFIQVRDMLGDGRLIKRRVVDGRGEFPMDCPLQDSLLRVHYKGMLLNEEKTLFYDTRTDNNGEPLEFSSGEGLVPEGLEMCVRLMLPGEIAIVTCPPDYAYDKFARPPNVPEGAHVQWEIELLGFEMPKDWTGLNFQEIMDDAEKIKNTGNRLFKEGKFELAKAKYEKVLREYNHVNPQDDEGKIFLNSRNSLHLNVAACYQKMGEHRKSVDTCNKVLDANPVHVKALYRRGMAYMLVGDFDEARKDFEKMITVDRNSERDASAALLKLKQKEQEVEKTQRKQFKGLFDKKPGEISEVGDSVDIKSPRDAEPDEVANSSEERSTRSDQNGDDTERVLEPERMGFLGWLWPSGNRILTALGLNRCSIL